MVAEIFAGVKKRITSTFFHVNGDKQQAELKTESESTDYESEKWIDGFPAHPDWIKSMKEHPPKKRQFF